MSERARAPTDERHGPPTRLSTRISMLVFWCLALLALVFAFLLLRGTEQELSAQREATVERFVHRVERVLSVPRGAPAREEIARELDRMRAELDVQGAALRFRRDRAITSGETAAGLDRYTRSAEYYTLENPSRFLSAELIVYFSPLDEVIHARRRELLLGLGVLFLLSGIAMRWVLERSLNRPIARMVATAEAISRGETDRRFDETNPDEFGYLGGFINEAMCSLVAKHEQLHKALRRVQDSEGELYREKELAEVTLHSIGEGVITTDRHGCIQYMNPVAMRLTGYQLKAVRGQPAETVIPVVDENTGCPAPHPVPECLEREAVVEMDADHAIVRQDGRVLAVTKTVAPIRGNDGAVLGTVVVFADVSDHRAMQRELSYHASHDALTGLYNRREFERYLEDALMVARRDNKTHALCYVDLDQFKVINDTCGHVAGDDLLRDLSLYLQQRLRRSDVLARLGGDEFGVLLTHCELECAMEIAGQLRRSMEQFRFSWEGRGFQVGASIGVVMIDSDTANVGEALSAADIACYAAKEQGRNRIHVYHPGDAELTRRRSEMAFVTEVTQALAEDRFELHYQCIVPTEGPADAPTSHCELLVRMIDTEGELVSPGLFIPAAERYGLMPQLDRWVVRSACAFLRSRAGRETAPLTLAVNLSGHSVGDPDFLDFVVRELSTPGTDPARLCFELTETAAVSNLGAATKFMNVLHGLGCSFALDDFGSGLSSFSYLKNLPVDYLKIDGVFVRQVADSPVDRAMVDAIARVGRVMGMKTIAEFVENEAILKVLREVGVDFAQGYGIGRPRPLALLVAEMDGVPGDAAGGNG